MEMRDVVDTRKLSLCRKIFFRIRSFWTKGRIVFFLKQIERKKNHMRMTSLVFSSKKEANRFKEMLSKREYPYVAGKFYTIEISAKERELLDGVELK